MARPRKLNAAKVGNHNKEELEQSEMRENSLEQFKKIDVENIPDDLTENGKKEWLRVVPLLQQLPIAELDYDRIKRYCQLVALTDDAYKHIMTYGTINDEGTKRTPQYFNYMDGLKELKSLCGSLGMTIDSRMKLVVPSENQVRKSVYDEFGVDDDD
ncbi:phage terminase small subunit P27 family [Staphylococcus saprophyticus]|uniref:Putative terminase small subunit n=1 Tax=uncultured Caudovirales phage TaxID=2100421 RepID=A0A2H4J2Q1_9CAUD|nr:phage terminase small subunit P27 family [Staphylococcus saprophyticus]ASN69395.1 putative terminase small subunit [uncultured Caudovirales phage]MDW3928273.1 phage terminase small subunit P27 family [Staphylococcus saprophyticus]MDW4097928.1 phage terminase small subunit P27 family [Staphylococcus saprophyticus]MDW4129930.1 phage terminase small subunit P27 family [Staphylococcus saprophyticus]MDW4327790.1 phage terminase small subunit P27 family [Staphylococcus saprophyticus]